jgi:hypothetical protein
MAEAILRYDRMGMRASMDKQLLMRQHVKIVESTQELHRNLKNRNSMLAMLMFSKKMHMIMAECASEMAKQHREYEEEEVAFRESYKTYFCRMTKMDPSEYEDYFLFLAD